MKNTLGALFCLVTVLLNQTVCAQTLQTATATTVTFNNDFVVQVNITGGGAGYEYPPAVSFVGVGNGAGAYSVISNGAVTQIIVTNTGSGYTSVPSVVIAPPTAGLHSFSSGSAYITVPDSASLNSTTNQLTVECWFNLSTPIGDWTSLVSKEANSTVPGDWDLRIANDQVYGLIQSTSDDSFPNSTGNSHPTYPVWHHAAMQFDQTNYTVWVDGSLVYQSTNEAGQFVLSSNPVTIGSQNSGFREFYGLISEVRISNVVRYTAPFSPQIFFTPDTNTVALYHLDEGSGTIVHDASGNGNNGVISGTSAWSTNVPAISPLIINVERAVCVSFANLQVGANYQLQTSTNLYGGSWSNAGAPFTATNAVMTPTNYWNVNNWNSLFFRLTQ
jgi:hypothetical protein